MRNNRFQKELKILHNSREEDILYFINEKLLIDADEIISIAVYPENDETKKNLYFVKFKNETDNKPKFTVFSFNARGIPQPYKGPKYVLNCKDAYKLFRDLVDKDVLAPKTAYRMFIVWGGENREYNAHIS